MQGLTKSQCSAGSVRPSVCMSICQQFFYICMYSTIKITLCRLFRCKRLRAMRCVQCAVRERSDDAIATAALDSLPRHSLCACSQVKRSMAQGCSRYGQMNKDGLKWYPLQSHWFPSSNVLFRILWGLGSVCARVRGQGGGERQAIGSQRKVRGCV
ncbi:hypothetical protein K504DRAFT_160783 [Pleomassaria siparia CBS 279.74]|uniref:Uncharacterized protein n=1 Tax=Pleomassaria siparia CBS 279.74 TaxID=1314801 RepID=A0A6G1JV77_9PLEO|nr:hypothetical protein K504DRAFT_160783 [Pleomassaria siparia CBS 279.74]